MKKITFWVDTIRNEEIVLTNGEYEFHFRIPSPKDGTSQLPDEFREATIEDRFQIQIEKLPE